MNEQWKTVLTYLTLMKLGTGAQHISFETALYGMKVRVDWEDDCHCIRVLDEREISGANYSIIEQLVEYFNQEHDRIKTK